MEVIDLFGEDETRDELGLGTIRDGFADLLFVRFPMVAQAECFDKCLPKDR